jgi:glutamate-1-semialdehyde 2,1-aminomutase
VWDANGREYVDMTMAWGSVLLGHAHPKIVEAAFKQARTGTNYASISTRMVELAERIAALSPCIERIRFVASGTEATFMCLRVARGATGRRKILKFEGAYHGQHPTGVASMVDVATPPASDGSGTGAPWVEEDVLAAPYNNLEAVGKIFDSYATELAAVIVEPLHRCLTPEPGFLAGLRELTRRHGVALIFDEVVTGFRLALGGAQEYYGVVPDLVAYGKAVGGGFPLGVYGGRAELMEVVNEHRLPGPNYVWSASTTGGNPVSAAASLAAIDLLSEAGVYPRLHALGRQLRQRMAEVLLQSGVQAQVLGDGPLAQVAFASQPVRDHRSWLASDRARGRALMLALVRDGVFLNPMGTKLYLSLAHDDRAIDQFLERFARFFASEK